MIRQALRLAPLALLALAGCSNEATPAPVAGPPETPAPAPTREVLGVEGTFTVTIVRKGDDAPTMREIWLSRDERKILPERKEGAAIYHFDNLDSEAYTLEVVDSEAVRRSFPDQFAGVPFELVLESVDWSAFEDPTDPGTPTGD